jgi:hypothetical protein
MKLNVRAWALTCAIVWGGAMLVMSLLNLAWAGYAESFLHAMASVYPGYHATRSLVDVVIGTVYGTADGFIGGAIFSWLHNRLTGTAA